MKSKGQNQGFQCIKCGEKSKTKTLHEIRRKIKKQLYLPVSSAHRHLTRPRQRYGIKNSNVMFDKTSSWFHIFKN